jgi:hypothetical protein
MRCQCRASKPHENHQTASSFGPSVISSKYPTSVVESRFHPDIDVHLHGIPAGIACATVI